MKFIPITLLFAFFSVGAWGQNVNGTVVDAYSSAPIPGARLVFTKLDMTAPIVTDDKGQFSVVLPETGRYTIAISREQYQDIRVSSLLVNAGEQTLTFQLIPAAFEMETIVVKADDTWSPLSQIQGEVIGIEQTERVAANFQDPVRIANSYAGVVQLNDQANHLSIRGLSPVYSKYFLEGLEIVNPNHTNNAGTLSDQPTQAGGGVNMFSAQVLGNTELGKGVQDIEYSNALGGILNLNYKKTSPSDFSFSPSISLIGVDLKAEAPLFDSKENTIMANYRYSTVGLLSALGVPLGDEDIRYQDVHLVADLKVSDRSNLRLFGFYGDDQNVFLGSADSTEREIDKDRFNIDYKNRIGGGGFKYRALSGRNSVLNVGVAYSENNARRVVRSAGGILRVQSAQRQMAQKLSANVSRESKMSDRVFLNVGVQYRLLHRDEFSFRSGDLGLGPIGGRISHLMRPYGSLTYQVNKQWTLRPALGLSYWHTAETFVFEPKVDIDFRPDEQNAFSLGYQYKSQDVYLPPIFFGAPVTSNFVQPTRAHQLQLEYSARINASSSISTSLFYTKLQETYVFTNAQEVTYLSQIFDQIKLNDLAIPTGSEQNYGVETSYQLTHASGQFFNVNATYYRAQVMGMNGWESARFDGKYIFNAQYGKEWEKQKEKHIRTIGISVRVTYLGGLLERPIDVLDSRKSGETIFLNNSGYSEKLPDYFRPDLSVYILKNKARYSSRWFLDIQNVASIENAGFNYYDGLQQMILTKNQLGIIPILGWRAEF